MIDRISDRPRINEIHDSVQKYPYSVCREAKSSSIMSTVSTTIFGAGKAEKRNVSTLFDKVSLPDVVNLKMGAPGECILKQSSQALKEATVHRMVGDKT